MSNLARGDCASTPLACAGLRLISILVGLGAFHGPVLAQSGVAPAVGSGNDGAQRSRPQRTDADHAHSQPLRLYRTLCIECHDTDGRGEPLRDVVRAIPDFTRAEWHRSRTNDRLVHSIKEGTGSMPAMKNKLRETEVLQLVSLVRNFRGGRQLVADEPDDEDVAAKPADLKKTSEHETTIARALGSAAPAPTDPVNRTDDRGRGTFLRFCATCHGADGHGTALRAQMPGIPDFGSAVWQKRRNNAQLTNTILEGQGTGMPSFRGKLDESVLPMLVTYLRAFAPDATLSTVEPHTDFKRRFQQLTNEMDDLKRQYRALSTQ